MTLELTPGNIATAGAIVSTGIGTCVKILWDRFNAAEARAVKDFQDLKSENVVLRVANQECEAKHTLTAIALAKVGAALEAMKQAMERCNLAECPLQPDKPKRQTTRVQPRPHP